MMLIIPYGTAEWREESNAPRVTVDLAGGDPLRLNDGPYEFTELPPLAGSGTSAERMVILRDHLTQFCDQWAKRARQFMTLYFRFVDEVIARDRAAIEAHLGRHGGLFTADDYAFSALRPLPRAHLAWDESQRVRVDFAFWTGARLVAVDVTGDEARGTAWAERARRLDAAGIQRVDIPAVLVAKDDTAELHQALPAEFAGFWRGEPMPSSPFKASALGDFEIREPEF